MLAYTFFGLSALSHQLEGPFAVVYAVFLGIVHRKLNFAEFYLSLVHIGRCADDGRLGLGARRLDRAREQIAMMLAQNVSEMVSSPTLIFVAILLLVLGLFMDATFMDATPVILMPTI
ncbi:TRAP transporter large permease subunit [Paracoccus sp. FO-3]|uniref:TRAP transporter large permease subunit n=1 Tax=Paracoccus sp. FO-3 TaxID=1335059 RepID=UPI002106438D|nr:TRAP transporter large permease subunit [Paracoccus sp. FO-3]